MNDRQDIIIIINFGKRHEVLDCCSTCELPDQLGSVFLVKTVFFFLFLLIIEINTIIFGQCFTEILNYKKHD